MSLTTTELLEATKRSAATLAVDPAVRHYSPEAIALVHRSTVLALCGAGGIVKAASRIAADPDLAEVPVDVIEAVMVRSFVHFTKALNP